VLAGAALWAAAAFALAQSFPVKPVRIVTAEAGGGVDLTARLIAPGLSASLGQPVIVENRGGANGVIAGETVAKSPADGHTLLHYSSLIWTVQFLQSVPFDAARDFTPVTLAASSPNVLVVHPSLPVKSAKELIALAKARPGQLNYATGGSGTTGHLSAELFKFMAGVDMVRVRYKGGGPAVNDLIGGQVQLLFVAAPAVATHVRTGRLRALAVTSAQPSALVPGLPTIAASGLPGYELVSTFCVFAPARTPETIVRRLSQDIVRIVGLPEVKEKFFNAGVEAVGNTPEQFAAYIKFDMARMNKLIQDGGIRAD
jgi:tripartite-type tricarboxylate transporter receptor subunit TctC